jgi:hypothetical protein
MIRFGIMNRAGHIDQRDFSIRFVVYTEGEQILFSVHNVCFLLNQRWYAPNDLYDARPNALVSGNEAVTMISGSESSASFAAKKMYQLEVLRGR